MPRKIDAVTPTERQRLLATAQVWRPIDTAALDLLAGPSGEGSLAFQQPVACAFAYPDAPLSGATPKFECTLPGGEVVKVKYGRENGEVFAEVAATRLFWALGFVVDRMYPAVVTCSGCPIDPHLASTGQWHLGSPAKVQTVRFDPAVIERKVEGEAIEVPGYKGWSWQELDDIRASGPRRAQLDALKLLAVLVQHVDSKPEQQALVCPPDRQRRDAQGNATCAAPLLVVKDLGSTFGAARKLRYEKMKLASWRSVPVWKDPARCQGNLTRSLVGTLEHPVISEAGRRFLADRLRLLSDRQLHALFTAARVDQRPDKVNGRQATVDDWVVAFKAKRDAITMHRCPVA